MKFLLAIGFALITSSSSIASITLMGNGVGNGGDVVTCYEHVDSPASIEILDFYEARVLRGILPDLGSAELPFFEKVKLALKRLSLLSPNRYREYSERASRFMEESIFVSGAELIDIPDSNHIVLPINCRIEQIAVQRTEIFPGDKTYIINKDLWNRLDNDSKAGLILHEVIYREYLLLKINNSSQTRYFNSYIFSGKVGSLQLLEFMNYLKSIDLYTNEIHGVLLRQPVEFYPSGAIKSGYVGGDTPFRFQEQDIVLMGGQFTFHENRAPKSFNVDWAKPLKITLGGQMLIMASEMEFYEDSTLARGSTNTLLMSPTYRIQRGDLKFYHSGGVMSVFGGPVEVLVQGQWLSLSYGSVNFHETGVLELGSLTSVVELHVQGQPIILRGFLRLSEEGNVIQGILQRQCSLKVGEYEIVFRTERYIEFYRDGRVRKGVLNHSVKLPTIAGDERFFSVGSELQFDLAGRVIVNG